MRRAPDAAAYAALGALVICWGGAFLFMRVAAVETGGGFVAAARSWLGAGFVLGAALMMRRSLPRDRRRIAFAAWIGFTGVALPFSLLAFASERLDSGVVGVLIAGVPLFVAPLSHMLSPLLNLDERVTPMRALGLLIGAAGVGAIFGLDTLAQIGSADTLAQLACVAAALSYAVSSVSIRAAPPSDPVGVAALQLAFGALYLTPLGLMSLPTEPPSPAAIAALVALGVAATGLAMVLRVYVIREAGPVFLSTVGYLLPLVALLLGWLVLGERFEAGDLLGAGLILSGVAMAQGLFERRV